MKALFEDDSNDEIYLITDIGGGWYGFPGFPVTWSGCVCYTREEAIAKGHEILKEKEITNYKIVFKEFDE